jgi:hypothetical protein
VDDIIKLQEKVAYLELRVADLEEALGRETGGTDAVVERVELLERALQTLALRTQHHSVEVLGANVVDDPVPHSG